VQSRLALRVRVTASGTATLIRLPVPLCRRTVPLALAVALQCFWAKFWQCHSGTTGTHWHLSHRLSLPLAVAHSHRRQPRQLPLACHKPPRRHIVVWPPVGRGPRPYFHRDDFGLKQAFHRESRWPPEGWQGGLGGHSGPSSRNPDGDPPKNSYFIGIPRNPDEITAWVGHGRLAEAGRLGELQKGKSFFFF